MGKVGKAILNIVIVAVVFALTVYYVFAGEDLAELGRSIMACDWRWLVPACGLVIFFVWGESYIIRQMLKQFGYVRGRFGCFLVSAVGFFFCAVTPSASGGQPMQLYFMNKMKVPVSISTIILMVVTMTYKMVLVIVQIGILIFCRGLVEQYLGGVLYIVYLGMLLNLIGIGGLVLFVFYPVSVRVIAGWTVKLLQKLKMLKTADKIPQKVEKSLDRYHDASDYLRANFKMIAQIQLFSFVQRFALFFVTCCVYWSLSLKGTPWMDILLLQSTISLSVDMLPMPGGMGISEYLFEQIFQTIFGEHTLTGLVLSRGISFYVQLFVCAAGTLAACILIGIKKENVKEQENS